MQPKTACLSRRACPPTLSKAETLSFTPFFQTLDKLLFSFAAMGIIVDDDGNVDYYSVLGLPSGEEGAKLTLKEISRAYKLKALDLHPDKRPDDPNAHANFQKLKEAYETLKDAKARKSFDDLLQIKREKREKQYQQDSKRRKMMSDLEQRERAAFAPDPDEVKRRMEERIVKEFHEQATRIRAMVAANKGAAVEPESKKETVGVKESVMSNADKEKILKVSWEKGGGEDYSAQRLRELFSKFGDIQDVVIQKVKKKRGLALVSMATKEAAIAATGSVSGYLSNPLLVLPYYKQPEAAKFSPGEADRLKDLAGTKHKEYEDSVLEKLLRAGANQKKSDA